MIYQQISGLINIVIQINTRIMVTKPHIIYSIWDFSFINKVALQALPQHRV